MSEVIHIEATVRLPRSRVWTLYNAPEHIVNWNFASDDWRCPSAESDFRVGGKLNYRMEAKDGSFGFDFEAIYDEVAPETRVAYTLLDGRKVATSFEDLDGATCVSTSFEEETEHSAEMQRAGWQAILNNFKRYAESA